MPSGRALISKISADPKLLNDLEARDDAGKHDLLVSRGLLKSGDVMPSRSQEYAVAQRAESWSGSGRTTSGGAAACGSNLPEAPPGFEIDWPARSIAPRCAADVPVGADSRDHHARAARVRPRSNGRAVDARERVSAGSARAPAPEFDLFAARAHELAGVETALSVLPSPAIGGVAQSQQGIFFALSGTRPFADTDREALFDAHLHRAAPLLSSVASQNIPPSLERIIGRCMDKLPSERYAAAHALLEELQQVAMALE
jgi:hypothetical protein